MIFKSHIGKRVMVKNREIIFVSEIYETEDNSEISVLSSAIDVERQEEKPKKQKSEK